MFAIGTVMGKTMTKTWEKRQQAFSDLSDFAQENFSGIAVIKAFVKELKELIAFRKLNKDNEEVNVEYTRISVLLEVMVTFFVESVICVILATAAILSTREISMRVSWWSTSAISRRSSGPSCDLDAHRKDLPRQSLPQPHHRAAGRTH